MDLTELKKDFYKRFNASDNFLYFTANGVLCTLLGCNETEYTPALSCTLSMGVKMFARRLDGGVINIQENTEDQSLSYIFSANSEHFHGRNREFAKIIHQFEPYSLRGTQILFEYSAPEFLPRREVCFTSLAQSFAKVSNLELEPLKLASLASCGDNINTYLGIIYSKKGYCTLVSTGTPKRFPLPLTGYKILSIHCAQKQRDRAKQIRYAFEHIRRLFPHVATIADVTQEMLTMTAPHIRSRQAMKYMCHLVDENARIETAISALKRCDERELFRQMQLSQASMERYWDLDKEHIFLANCCKPLNGIAAVRSWNNGVTAIIEDNMIDQTVNIIRREFESNIGYQPAFCVSEPF